MADTIVRVVEDRTEVVISGSDLLAPLVQQSTDAAATATQQAGIATNAAASLSASASALVQTINRPKGATLIAGNATSGDYVAVFADPIVGLPKKLRQMRYRANVAQRIRIFKQDIVGGQRIQRGPDHFYTTIVGNNIMTAADIPTLRLGPGQTIGFGDTNGVFANDTTLPADGAGFCTASNSGGSRVGTLSGPFTNQQQQVGFDFEVDPDAATAPRIVGKAATPVAGNTTSNNGFWLIFVDPAQRAEYIKAIPLYAATAGTLNLAVWDGTSGAQMATYAVPIVSGFQVLTPATLGTIPVQPGQVVSFRSGSVASTTGINGTRFSFVASTATSFNPNDNAAAQNTQELQIQFQMEALSDLDASLDTRVKANSTALAPITASARKLRAAITTVTQSAGAIVLVGDSISEHYYATNDAGHWFTQFRTAIIGDVDPNGAIGVTNLGGGSDNAAWYGLTLAGSISNDTSGTIGQMLVMGAGATVTFTGNYASIAYTVDRSASAGTMTLTRANGGSPVTIDTFSTAGGTAPDIARAAATGFASSDTYTLTASGGTVRLTSVHRIGARPAGTLAPHLMRMALSGQSTSNFVSDARIASAIVQSRAVSPGSVPLFIVALGTNNAVNSNSKTTPAQYRADLERMFARYQAAGAYVASVGLIRPNVATWPMQSPGAVFDDYLAAHRSACERYNVPVLALDGYDFLGTGLLSDGLHPNNAGFAFVNSLAQSWMVSDAFTAALAVQQRRFGRIDVTVSGAPTLLAMGGSTARRTDGAAGSTLYVNQAGDTYAAAWAAVA